MHVFVRTARADCVAAARRAKRISVDYSDIVSSALHISPQASHPTEMRAPDSPLHMTRSREIDTSRDVWRKRFGNVLPSSSRAETIRRLSRCKRGVTKKKQREMLKKELHRPFSAKHEHFEHRLGARRSRRCSVGILRHGRPPCQSLYANLIHVNKGVAMEAQR